MNFFLSTAGQFLWQSVLHSFLIALIVEAVMSGSRVREPLLQIKFRSLSLWLPVVYLPILYFFDPSRTGSRFQQHGALFDSNLWLDLKLRGIFLWYFAVAIIAVTILFFVWRELIPAIRSLRSRRNALPVLEKGKYPQIDSLVAELARKMNVKEPTILISDEPTVSVYTLGQRALVLSESAIGKLDNDELEAVIAHELAHFTRQTLLVGRICLILRFLMFYNPVALLVYHRINHDAEKFCDDFAVSATGKRLALVSGMLKMLKQTTGAESRAQTVHQEQRRAVIVNMLENKAYLALVKERAERILNGEPQIVVSYQEQRIAVLTCLLMVLLFFVV